jgi:hypothetical protein
MPHARLVGPSKPQITQVLIARSEARRVASSIFARVTSETSPFHLIQSKPIFRPTLTNLNVSF